MAFTTVSMIVILIIPIGGIVLQIFLSRLESWIPGLILPGVTLLYSILTVLNLFVPEALPDLDVVLMMLSSFILGNIPTLVLLAIYFACRGKHRRKKQMDKMNIQDLE